MVDGLDMILSAQFHAHALELYKNIASYDKKNSGLEVCLSKKRLICYFQRKISLTYA